MPSVLQLYFALSLFHLYIHLLGEWSSTVTSPMAGVCHSRQLTVPRWAKCIATSFGVRREGMLTDDAWPSLFGQTCMSESLSVPSFMFMYLVHCGWLGWTVILCQNLQTHVPNPMPSYLMPSCTSSTSTSLHTMLQWERERWAAETRERKFQSHTTTPHVEYTCPLYHLIAVHCYLTHTCPTLLYIHLELSSLCFWLQVYRSQRYRYDNEEADPVCPAFTHFFIT